MKRIIMSLLIVSMSLILASCKGDRINIAGNWKLSGDTLHDPFEFVEMIEFKTDGKIITDSNNFPYTEYELKQDRDGTEKVIFKGINSNQTYILNKVKNDSKKLYITNSKHTDEFKDMVIIKQ